jgi:VIT1/CCC1 family predicted Fe2+/Mn2+ transporter
VQIDKRLPFSYGSSQLNIRVSVNEGVRNSRMKSNWFAAAIMVALIIGGAVTVVVLYSTVDSASAFIATVAIALAVIFLLAVYIVNARQTGS